jgi:acyl phosphate:glycerol-3-phosphate acyltransferase
MPEIVSSPITLILTAALAYLVGSIPFGMVMAKLFGLGDLRKIGSGNIGATNVLRTGNKLAAGLTLGLDAAKGGLAVLAAGFITGHGDAAQLAGLMAFAGHLFPVWIGFKGGKGVATFLGTLIALHWPLGLTACAIWLVAALLSRISSSGALSAAALSPLAAWFYGYRETILLAIVLGVLVIWRHRGNIDRMLKGVEPRIGQGKGGDSPS